MKGEIDNEITLRDRDSIWQEDTADHVTGSPTKNSRLGVEVATERIKDVTECTQAATPGAISGHERNPKREVLVLDLGPGSRDLVEPRRYGCESRLMITPSGDLLVKKKKNNANKKTWQVLITSKNWSRGKCHQNSKRLLSFGDWIPCWPK